MLILSKEDQIKQAQGIRNDINKHFNNEMEKILNANSAKEKYWILGKLKFPPELGGHVGRTFLQACDEKPGLVKESFLYEVDNKLGAKTLLWVMNPDGSLRLPTLGKTIKATPAQRANNRAIIT